MRCVSLRQHSRFSRRTAAWTCQVLENVEDGSVLAVSSPGDIIQSHDVVFHKKYSFPSRLNDVRHNTVGFGRKTSPSYSANVSGLAHTSLKHGNTKNGSEIIHQKCIPMERPLPTFTLQSSMEVADEVHQIDKEDILSECSSRACKIIASPYSYFGTSSLLHVSICTPASPISFSVTHFQRSPTSSSLGRGNHSWGYRAFSTPLNTSASSPSPSSFEHLSEAPWCGRGLVGRRDGPDFEQSLLAGDIRGKSFTDKCFSKEKSLIEGPTADHASLGAPFLVEERVVRPRGTGPLSSTPFPLTPSIRAPYFSRGSLTDASAFFSLRQARFFAGVGKHLTEEPHAALSPSSSFSSSSSSFSSASSSPHLPPPSPSHDAETPRSLPSEAGVSPLSPDHGATAASLRGASPSSLDGAAAAGGSGGGPNPAPLAAPEAARQTVLHWRLKSFADSAALSEADRLFREKVLKFLRKCAAECFSKDKCKIKVQPFGSYVAGLATRANDLDVVITGLAKPNESAGGYQMKQRMRVATHLSEIRQHIEDEAFINGLRIKNVKLIPRARIPLLRFEAVATKATSNDTMDPVAAKGSSPSHPQVCVDLCVSDTEGPTAAMYMSYLVDNLPALRPLVVAVKALLRNANLNEVSTGGISSFALTNLAVAHIQEESKGGQSTTDVGLLFVSFLERYGMKYDTCSYAVSVDRGGIIERPDVPLHGGYASHGAGSGASRSIASRSIASRGQNDGWGDVFICGSSTGQRPEHRATESGRHGAKGRDRRRRGGDVGIHGAAHHDDDDDDGDCDYDGSDEEEDAANEWSSPDPRRSAYRETLYVECPLTGRNVSAGTYRMSEITNLFRSALRKVDANSLREVEASKASEQLTSADAALVGALGGFNRDAMNHHRNARTGGGHDAATMERDLSSILTGSSYRSNNGGAFPTIGIGRNVLKTHVVDDFVGDADAKTSPRASKLHTRHNTDAENHHDGHHLTSLEKNMKRKKQRDNDNHKTEWSKKPKKDHGPPELSHKSKEKKSHNNSKQSENHGKKTKEAKSFGKTENDYGEWNHGHSKKNVKHTRLDK